MLQLEEQVCDDDNLYAAASITTVVRFSAYFGLFHKSRTAFLGLLLDTIIRLLVQLHLATLM